jgi:hypothetical protein
MTFKALDSHILIIQDLKYNINKIKHACSEIHAKERPWNNVPESMGKTAEIEIRTLPGSNTANRNG